MREGSLCRGFGLKRAECRRMRKKRIHEFWRFEAEEAAAGRYIEFQESGKMHEKPAEM